MSVIRGRDSNVTYMVGLPGLPAANRLVRRP